MLELDLLLLPFFDACYDGLSPELQQAFQGLLACHDPEIHAWLLQLDLPVAEELQRIVHLIIEFHQHQTFH